MQSKLITAIIAVMLSFSIGQTWAQDKKTQPPVFSTPQGAIGGYDVMRYYQDGGAVKGADSITATWNGATWKFSSVKNRDEFLSAPEKFAPQYGGYCAFGMSNNYKAPTSPDAWTIIDNKLYLNYNKQVQAKWKTETEKRIPTADENWKKF